MPRGKTNFINKSVKYSIPYVVNHTPSNVKDKVYTHSLHGFQVYAKKHFVSLYEDVCSIENCYICMNND